MNNNISLLGQDAFLDAWQEIAKNTPGGLQSKILSNLILIHQRERDMEHCHLVFQCDALWAPLPPEMKEYILAWLRRLHAL